MNLAPIVLSTSIALAVAAAILGVAMIVRARAARRTRGRLQEISRSDAQPGPGVQQEIARDTQLTSLPALLRDQPLVGRLQQLLEQGDMNIRIGPFLGLMLILALVGGIAAAQISGSALTALIGAPFAGSIPVWFAVRKKAKRLAAFEKNFPDALDILTSALRAGLAFSGAIQVVSEESPDPVAKEFGTVFEENRLGLDMKEALRNLALRVDSAELRMFVTAVILQRETGGNLTEILDMTAHVIRDRFRILGEVRALTAQQRFSGIILSLLPIAMAGVLLVTAPDYMAVLIKDPWGPYLIGGALALQLIGYLAIRWIVAIKV